MSAVTTIEWSDRSWNPTRGCSSVSPGCENCYAARQALRFSNLVNGRPGPYKGLVRRMKSGLPQWTGKVPLIKKALAEPLSWHGPLEIFVNSMSDLFHKELDDQEIASVFGVMAERQDLLFQVLTKREDRLLDWYAKLEGAVASCVAPAQTVYCLIAAQRALGVCSDVIGLRQPTAPWPLPNVAIGVSAETQHYADLRWEKLSQVPAVLRWISMEPLLGPITMRRWATLPDWIVVGGESGPGSRPCEVSWIEDLVRECQQLGVKVFVKQVGRRPLIRQNYITQWASSVTAKCWSAQYLDLFEGRTKHIKGGDPAEWPGHLRIRERMPWPSELRT